MIYIFYIFYNLSFSMKLFSSIIFISFISEYFDYLCFKDKKNNLNENKYTYKVFSFLESKFNYCKKIYDYVKKNYYYKKGYNFISSINNSYLKGRKRIYNYFFDLSLKNMKKMNEMNMNNMNDFNMNNFNMNNFNMDNMNNFNMDNLKKMNDMLKILNSDLKKVNNINKKKTKKIKNNKKKAFNNNNDMVNFLNDLKKEN